jgi:hypothetical protein
MMSAAMDGGRDAKTWSWVRRTASAAVGEDTNRVGTAPRRRSMRPLRPCLASRSRMDLCVSAPMRWRWPMMGSLPGGEGGSCCLLLNLVAGDSRLMTSSRRRTTSTAPSVDVPWTTARCRYWYAASRAMSSVKFYWPGRKKKAMPTMAGLGSIDLTHLSLYIEL